MRREVKGFGKGIVKGLVRAVVVLACVAGMVLGGPGVRARAGETKNTVTIHGKTYGIDYVNNTMNKYKAEDGRYRVTDFLNDEHIELLTVDNYKEKVYGSNKPVIVLDYVHNDYKGFSMREAIILKLLKEQFGGKIEVYGFDVTGYKSKAAHLAGAEISNFMDNYSDYIEKRNTPSAPSLLLYSPFDILKGETPENNDGKIKLIDVLRKGPSEDKGLFDSYILLRDYFFGPNLLLAKNEDNETDRLFNNWLDKYTDITKYLKNKN